MRRIDKIIIHCSATKEGQYVDVETIRRWHLKKGFGDIGYHYVIYLDGSVHEGRPLEYAGVHCKGQNAYSIGICYIGGLDKNLNPKDTRTADQEASLVKLIKVLKERFPGVSVHGHNEFGSKECPCFDVQKWRKEVGL